MRRTPLPALLALLIAGLLGACASAPPVAEQRPEPLLADARFGPPTEPVSTDGSSRSATRCAATCRTTSRSSCARRARRRG